MLQITFSRKGLSDAVGQSTACSSQLGKEGDDHYVVSVPVQLKRCGIETKFILTNEPLPQAHADSIAAIQSAMKRALHWTDILLTGQASSMQALAKEERITQRYIARLIKLSFLAPDIIEAILQGNVLSVCLWKNSITASRSIGQPSAKCWASRPEFPQRRTAEKAKGENYRFAVDLTRNGSPFAASNGGMVSATR
jgi:hypothetical protein